MPFSVNTLGEKIENMFDVNQHSESCFICFKSCFKVNLLLKKISFNSTVDQRRNSESDQSKKYSICVPKISFQRIHISFVPIELFIKNISLHEKFTNYRTKIVYLIEVLTFIKQMVCLPIPNYHQLDRTMFFFKISVKDYNRLKRKLACGLRSLND